MPERSLRRGLALPVAATATPVPSAAEQQHGDNDNQEQRHSEPRFRSRPRPGCVFRAVIDSTDWANTSPTRARPQGSEIQSRARPVRPCAGAVGRPVGRGGAYRLAEPIRRHSGAALDAHRPGGLAARRGPSGRRASRTTSRYPAHFPGASERLLLRRDSSDQVRLPFSRPKQRPQALAGPSPRDRERFGSVPRFREEGPLFP